MARLVQTPWLVEVASIIRRPGHTLSVDATMPSPSGIGDEFVGVTEGSPLHVAGSVDALLDGLITSLQVTAMVHAQCSRCLEDLSGPQTFPLTAFFPYTFNVSSNPLHPRHTHQHVASSATSHNTRHREDDQPLDGELGDVYPIIHDLAIDLESPLRDMLVDSINEQPLCSPTCQGLCSTCGILLSQAPNHQHETVDPRFAALSNWSST